jgi:RNA polymerase sigma factor (sigma-70 family)
MERSMNASFDDVVLSHPGAARRLARWLTRNEDDAEDVVQDASLRALRYFKTFTGGDGRAWFLTIVRNACGTRRARNVNQPTDSFDEHRHSDGRVDNDPETLLLNADAARTIDRAMRRLADRHRELILLRELQGLSYREMSEVMGVPMGTVMSGLSRARQAFRGALDEQLTR